MITDNISHTRSSMTWCRRDLLILVLKGFLYLQRALVVIAFSFVIFVSMLLIVQFGLEIRDNQVLGINLDSQVPGYIPVLSQLIS